MEKRPSSCLSTSLSFRSSLPLSGNICENKGLERADIGLDLFYRQLLGYGDLYLDRAVNAFNFYVLGADTWSIQYHTARMYPGSRNIGGRLVQTVTSSSVKKVK